jgi:uncharacterized protein (TIGR02001 family)
VRASGKSLVIVNALLLGETAVGEGHWSGFIAGTSDYVYRGASQTHGRPALQADLHYETVSSTFLGVWASTARPASDHQTAVELNAYVGRSWLVSADWRTKLTAVHYAYLDTALQGPNDYDEFVGGLAYRDRLFVTVAWSPNRSRYLMGNDVSRRGAASYELATHQPFANEWYLSGGAGYYDLSEIVGRGYWFWNAGLGYSLPHYQVDLSFFGADGAASRVLYSDSAHARCALTLSWRF